MSSVIVIPRVDPKDGRVANIGWYWEQRFVGAQWDLVIRCPHGHTARLSRERHTINEDDGMIRPSVYFKEICSAHDPQLQDWHVWVRLDGWNILDVEKRMS